MTTRKKHDQAADRRHDTAVEDSFPASDPPANSGVVGPRGGDAGRPKGTPTDERHATETAHVRENEESPPRRR